MTTPNDAVSAVASGGGPETAPGPFRRYRRVAMEIALFLGVFFAIAGHQERNLLARHSAAPGFSLASLDGPPVSLESLRGKRVLVHFWATWCGVCRREFSALDAVQRGLGPDEALVAVVADSDDLEHVRAVVKEEHIEYPVLLADAETLRAYRVTSFPTNYFLDAEGRVAGHTVGMSTRLSLRARLKLAR